jgi:hypothetical protein
LEVFKATLKDLSEIGINPVTIPKEWGVKLIPNLLQTYYAKVNEERKAVLRKEQFLNNLDDYIKEFGFDFD